MTRTTRPAPQSTVDGAALLDRLRDTIRRYAVLSSAEVVDAVALWIAATHGLPAWACAPRLVIRAPEKQCGKSRLLDVTEAASHNPLITVNASPAAVYRSIGTDDPPTLLIDEYDTIFGKAGDNEDLRGLLNAGHQRNRPALRYDANTQRVEKIPTFAMAAMAGIGPAPDTIEDRAVVVHMRRRKRGEKIQPWRIERDRPIVMQLGTLLHDWITANLAQLKTAQPVMPVEDRAADTWEPLIAIADLAGGDWPIRARTAAVTLTGAREETATTSDRVRLLTDCRVVFHTATETDILPSSHILGQLKSMDESPWAELTPHRLGATLREFGITSITHRFPTGQAKGYMKESFADAWDRYCADDDTYTAGEAYQASHPYQPSSGAVRNLDWYGLKRTTQDSVPGLTSSGTLGTDGTDTPHSQGHPSTDTNGSHGHLRLVDGGA